MCVAIEQSLCTYYDAGSLIPWIGSTVCLCILSTPIIPMNRESCCICISSLSLWAGRVEDPTNGCRMEYPPQRSFTARNWTTTTKFNYPICPLFSIFAGGLSHLSWPLTNLGRFGSVTLLCHDVSLEVLIAPCMCEVSNSLKPPGCTTRRPTPILIGHNQYNTKPVLLSCRDTGGGYEEIAAEGLNTDFDRRSGVQEEKACERETHKSLFVDREF